MFTIEEGLKASMLFDKLEDYRCQKGLRNTPERKEVLKAILEIEGEFTALDVCAYASDDVSQPTVYNCITLFIEADIIEEVPRIGKEKKYRVKYHD